MFFQTEDATVVKTDPFKNSVAIKQTVIEHGDFGLAFSIKFSVDINLRRLGRGLYCARLIDRRFHRFT